MFALFERKSRNNDARSNRTGTRADRDRKAIPSEALEIVEEPSLSRRADFYRIPTNFADPGSLDFYRSLSSRRTNGSRPSAICDRRAWTISTDR
ncbi:hypothetical protein GWI33_017104 [Rhynchophorus ferrugineus]|uniref:Uncharacterized protein n=1 Tax=Rhynchophorus ferrugineus TaxID=354439 RepID=A0A834M9L6_RHYFE|nr:hypothetical protein GWI33_017104 [Rhynchophorus ferrugineus]